MKQAKWKARQILRDWENKKQILKAKEQVKKEKHEIKKPLSKITTAKLLVYFLFINCTLIELFTGWIMVKSIAVALATGAALDMTPLVALIGTGVAEVIGYGIYALKSTKENTAGGIVFESAMKNSVPEEENKESMEDDTTYVG